MGGEGIRKALVGCHKQAVGGDRKGSVGRVVHRTLKTRSDGEGVLSSGSDGRVGIGSSDME